MANSGVATEDDKNAAERRFSAPFCEAMLGGEVFD